jgi:hypothetical protein
MLFNASSIPPSSIPQGVSFIDQLAFRPYGSPCASIIFLLNMVTNLLLFNPYVIVISLDFSKAFGTLQLLCHRHLLRLQQGFWHSSAHYPDGEIGRVRPSRPSLQLVGRLLHRAHPLHCILWSEVNAKNHHTLHHPRPCHWTSGLCGDCK